MDVTEAEKPKEESSLCKLEASEIEEVQDTLCNSINSKDTTVSNSISGHNTLQCEEEISNNSEQPNRDQNVATSDAENTLNFLNDQSLQESSTVPVLNGTNNLLSNDKIENTTNDKLSEAVIKVPRPLCADYKSDSESESVDSESDSSTVSSNTSNDTSSDNDYMSDDSCDSGNSGKGKKQTGRKLKKDLSLSDLPPIEDLKISVPEDACIEIGTITSIVETLVVVESYKGTAALDLDTILFLDCGKRTLGKVFDILGPINEPVYTVRFNSQEQIKNLNIEKNLKVYYAPKTQHTNFVFMSEVLKNRGSDASWKDNVEAPPEFQDFSDDEQERLHRNKQARDLDRENQSSKEQTKSKKRPYNKTKQNSDFNHGTGFRNPNFCQPRRPNIPRGPSSRPFLPPFHQSGPQRISNPIQTPPHPGTNPMGVPPPVCFPPRFSGPPFPVFGGIPVFNQGHNFQQPFYQHRGVGFVQNFGPWRRQMLVSQVPPPPPPPPPPNEQGDQRE